MNNENKVELKDKRKAEYIESIVNNRNKYNIDNIKESKEIVRNKYNNKDEPNCNKNKEDKLKDVYYIVDK